MTQIISQSSMSEWPLSTGLSTSLFIFQTSNVGGSSKVDVQRERERERERESKCKREPMFKKNLVWFADCRATECLLWLSEKHLSFFFTDFVNHAVMSMKDEMLRLA